MKIKVLLIGLILNGVSVICPGAETGDGPVIIDLRKDEASSKAELDKKNGPQLKLGGHFDRMLEVRIGPRMTFLTGPVRIGKTGTEFDVFDDLNMKPGYGLQVWVDYQPFFRWHLTGGFSWDDYTRQGTTRFDIRKSSGDQERLLAGALVDAAFDLYTFDGRIGYDAFLNEKYQLQPFIGLIGGIIDGKLKVTGSVTRSFGVSTTQRTDTFTTDENEVFYVLPFPGVEQRYYVTRNWYAGISVGGIPGEDFWFLTGDLYTGFDYPNHWGFRIGYSANVVNYENNGQDTFTQPVLGSVYVDAVWRF